MTVAPYYARAAPGPRMVVDNSRLPFWLTLDLLSYMPSGRAFGSSGQDTIHVRRQGVDAVANGWRFVPP